MAAGPARAARRHRSARRRRRRRPGARRRRPAPPRAGASVAGGRRPVGHRRARVVAVVPLRPRTGARARGGRPGPGPTHHRRLRPGEGGAARVVVQKLTELGVDRIVPFLAERSVVRWDPDKADRNAGRLRRVALEAAMQSRRTWLPEVVEVTTFAEVCALPGAAAAERRGSGAEARSPDAADRPRGGLVAPERAALPRPGGPRSDRAAGRDRGHHRGGGALRATVRTSSLGRDLTSGGTPLRTVVVVRGRGLWVVWPTASSRCVVIHCRSTMRDAAT